MNLLVSKMRRERLPIPPDGAVLSSDALSSQPSFGSTFASAFGVTVSGADRDLPFKGLFSHDAQCTACVVQLQPGTHLHRGRMPERHTSVVIASTDARLALNGGLVAPNSPIQVSAFPGGEAFEIIGTGCVGIIELADGADPAATVTHTSPLLRDYVRDAFQFAAHPRHAPYMAAAARALFDFIGKAGADAPPLVPSSRFREVEAFIAGNFRDPDMDVASVAAALSISKTALYAIVRPSGRTVHDLIIAARLAAARDALAFSAETKIADVARDCGFSDVSTFYRNYKRHFGQSPREGR